MRFFRTLLLTTCFLNVVPMIAQEPQTIKVKRESRLSKAVFDNTQMRLVIIDRYGNPRENRVMGFRLYIKTKKETREFTGFNNSLTGEMINYLNKQTKTSKLFFTGISAKDDDEHLVNLPDVIDTWFPDCKNCEKGR